MPVIYLAHDGIDWRERYVFTGLRSGAAAPMFVNLDADTTQEMFIGGVGPPGNGSCFALKHVSDTTWTVLWADSSLRNTPLSVNAGMLNGQFVVAGANTWDRRPLDTFYTNLNVYNPSGLKLGIWRRDTASVQNFHFLDIDNDGTTNLVAPVLESRSAHLAVYEYQGMTAVSEDVEGRPFSFALEQNYPNPFNSTTRIGFTLPQTEHVSLKVLNVLGQEVATLVNEPRTPGRFWVEWNALECASGVYLYELRTNTVAVRRKMLLLR